MKQFLPFLTDDQGRSLVLEDEVVVTRSIPDPLDNSPEGWENNTIQFARNNEFRGIIKSYTTPLKFYLAGAKILRDKFYRIGMEVVVFFIWLKQNTTFGAGMKYEGWYKGEVDFGTFKDNDLDNSVTVNITEGGFFKDLQANKSKPQEITFDEDTALLYMDGMNLNEILHFEIQDGFSTPWTENTLLMPLTFLNNEGASAGITYYSQLGQTKNIWDYTSQNFFLGNTIAFTPHFKINVKFEVVGGTEKLDFFLKTQTRQLYLSAPADYPVGSYNLTWEVDWALNPGEQVYFMAHIDAADATKFIGFHQSDVTVSYITRRAATVVNSYRAIDLGNKLTKKVSPNCSMTSPLLVNDYNLLISSGDAIRGFDNAVIKTTFSDYFKSIDAVKCASLDVVNNNPVLKSRYDDYNKNSTIASLGECSKWSLDPAEDYIYDSVEVGYPSKGANSNDDVNGKYSFNNTYNWKIDITRRKTNVYEAKSVYMADPWDIELIRLNFGGKTTTPANTDNSVFFFDAEPKTDISFTGILQFYNGTSQIKLTGDTTDIIPFIKVGAKIKVTGSANGNDSTYTITDVINIVLTTVTVEVKELVAADELGHGTVDLVNLYKLRRVAYTSIAGIPDDGTVFNVELSPRRILGNHLRWLRSSFDHLDANKLVFQTTDKNSDLVTTDGSGNVISEKADIPVASMGEKVYLPYYVSFEVKSPDNLLAVMTANSSGKFDYTRRGEIMDGFPIDIKTNDATLETQQYKLLQTANNNNLTLIR